MKRLILALFVLTLAPITRGADIYISQSGGGAGSSCVSPRAFSSLAPGDWSPGNIIHLCGTYTGTNGGNALTAQGSGLFGGPITIKFETGANLTSPVWGLNGAINIAGRSFITIDGGTNGIIQNTANGDALANRSIGTLIMANNCTSCIIKNLQIANEYVAIRNFSNPIGGLATQMNAITISGKNNQITSNVIHDCGWCIYDNYQNGDTHLEVDHNEAYNWDHYIMFANSGVVAATAPAFLWHDDRVHDNLNWENVTSGSCLYHLDALHIFGVPSATADGVYVYNNYFYGTNSSCSTGYIFVEGATSGDLVNSFWFNNVFDATGFNVININGCAGCGPVGGVVGIFASSSSMLFVNNVVLYKNSYDAGAQGFKIGGGVHNLTMKNNASNGFAVGNNLQVTSTPAGQIDRNFYGSACILSNNCFVFNGSFTGSFANWKSASSYDTNGAVSTFTGALLNSDGSPQPSSPILNLGANLTTSCSGTLTALCSSTTKGGTITPVARPGGATPWDAGAYMSASSPVAPSVPGGVTGTLSGSSTAVISWSASTGTAPITYTILRGTVSGGPYTAVGSTLTTSFNDTNLVANTYFYRVNATNNAGTSANSAQVSVTVPPIVSIPGAPPSLTASVAGSSVTLNWANSIGTPTNYNIKRGTVTGGPYSLVATVGLVNNYIDNSLPNNTYFYRVNATNAAGTSGDSPEAPATVLTNPALTANPANLDLGNVIVGTASCGSGTGCVTTIFNTGNANLVLAGSNAVTKSGPASADYTLSGTCTNGLVITPGNSCNISASITASTTGARQATIVILSNDPNSPDSIPLTANGVTGIVISPTALIFGNQYPNKATAAQSVTFYNNLGTTVTFSSIAPSTGDSSQFAVQSDGCSPSVGPGLSCIVSVRFQPTSTGTKNSLLLFTDSAGSQSIGLSGKANPHAVRKGTTL